MAKFAKNVIAVATIGLLSSGCATILNDDTQTLNVRTSNNSSVEVSVAGQTVTTPGSVTVARDGSDISAMTSASGCAQTTAIDREVDGVFFVNLLSGGVGGSTTDYASGKMWEYDTDVVVNCNN